MPSDPVNDIANQFGPGTIMRLDDAPANVPRHPTGSAALDTALGGGWPCGGIIELFGPPAAQPCLDALAASLLATQQASGCAALVDLRHGYVPGGHTSRLLLSQPDDGEQALDIVQALARSGAVGLIVVDSVAALVPQAVLDGSAPPDAVGLQARMMSKALRALTSIAARTCTTVLFLNETRSRRTVLGTEHEEVAGGNALKFYSSVRVRVSPSTVGLYTARVVKNKLAPPFRSAEFGVEHGLPLDVDALPQMGPEFAPLVFTGGAQEGER